MKAFVALVALALCSATFAKNGTQAASAAAGRVATPLSATTPAPSVDSRSDRARGRGDPSPSAGDNETTKDPYATPLFRMARPLK
jgi:hypothetical protein